MAIKIPKALENYLETKWQWLCGYTFSVGSTK